MNPILLEVHATLLFYKLLRIALLINFIHSLQFLIRNRVLYQYSFLSSLRPRVEMFANSTRNQLPRGLDVNKEHFGICPEDCTVLCRNGHAISTKIHLQNRLFFCHTCGNDVCEQQIPALMIALSPIICGDAVCQTAEHPDNLP